MFGGYNGRRRLKRLIAIIVGFLVLLALGLTSSDTSSIDLVLTSSSQLSETSSQPVATVRKRPGILANFEFTNSPYIYLNSMPTYFIPIFVLSKAVNAEVRDSIRRTWGFYRPYRNDTLRIRIFFIVGIDDFMTQRIRMEQIVFNDVIQVSLPDIYTFSAYKEISAMLWFRDYLPDLPFYIKAEDDLIVNMKVLVNEFLPILESIANETVVLGWFNSNNTVQRGTYQKFVDTMMNKTTDEFTFAMNMFYAVTTRAADRMLEKITQIKQIDFPGEPFVTGILRDAAGVGINNLGAWNESLKYEFSNGACKRAFKANPELFLCTSSLHMGSSRSMPEYFEAWNVLIHQS